MKILWLITVLFLFGCADDTIKGGKRSEPTPFTTSDKVIKLHGCIELHKDVKEWNEQHPNKEPRIADC